MVCLINLSATKRNAQQTGCALIMKLRSTRKNCKTKLMGEGEL